MSANPGTYREYDKRAVDFSEAVQVWTEAARTALLRTAKTYNGLISYKDLAEEVQVVTGVRTLMLAWHWIGRVLGGVARGCHERSEPLLSALCVHADGTIGEGYGKAIAENYGGAIPEDMDMAAAVERLECYRYFGAELPPGGGTPALTPQVAARRNRERVRTGAISERGMCPQCHLMLPLSGQCGNCS